MRERIRTGKNIGVTGITARVADILFTELSQTTVDANLLNIRRSEQNDLFHAFK